MRLFETIAAEFGMEPREAIKCTLCAAAAAPALYALFLLAWAVLS